MDFLSSNQPLILFFLAGFGMLLAEAFMPGFGIAGITGIVLEELAIYSVWIHYGPGPALIFTLAVLILIGITVFCSYRSAMRGRLSRSDLVLQDTQNPESSQVLKTLQALIGRDAVTATPLRPEGQVDLDGQRLNAASGGDFLEKGTKVRVVGAEGDHLLVRRTDAAGEGN